jgi:hypothetical protein
MGRGERVKRVQGRGGGGGGGGGAECGRDGPKATSPLAHPSGVVAMGPVGAGTCELVAGGE